MARLDWRRARPYRETESIGKPLVQRHWGNLRPVRKQPTARPSGATEAAARLADVVEAIVYCDGGCQPNPGPGGWGVVIIGTTADGQNKTVELFGGEPRTTNNRMEIQGAIEALMVLPTTCRTTIVSDSQYVVRGMNEWINGWRRKRFIREGAPIPNADLWRRLDSLARDRCAVWQWVRGHRGNTGNERADQLASIGRKAA